MHKTYSIFTNDGEQHTIEAANLRKALRSFTGSAESIVGAFEAECLPTPTEQSGPVVAVILRNPNFKEPPFPE